MKLLILSHPYNGACNFAAAVAADLGHILIFRLIH